MIIITQGIRGQRLHFLLLFLLLLRIVA